MNLYAVRDRLLDYYMQPFAGPDEKSVLAAIARTINNGDATSDIAQAPQHFEIWELGQVDQEGHINPTRRLICDCSSLIRPGVRQRLERQEPEATETTPGGRTAPGRGGEHTNAHGRPISSQAPPEGDPTAEVRRGPNGGYPPRGDG